jgi:hypothetical protein
MRPAAVCFQHVAVRFLHEPFSRRPPKWEQGGIIGLICRSLKAVFAPGFPGPLPGFDAGTGDVTVASRHNVNCMRLIRFTALFLAGLFLVATPTRAASETVWLIGGDEDPLASGYAPTDEFSSENYINDPRPGTVYTAANPVVDDDFYFPGTFPIGFNSLTTNRTVLTAETNRGWERALTDGDRTNRVHFALTGAQAGAVEFGCRCSGKVARGSASTTSPYAFAIARARLR